MTFIVDILSRAQRIAFVSSRMPATRLWGQVFTHGNDRHFDVNSTVNRHEQGIPPVTFIHGNDRHFDVNTTVNRHEQGIPPVTFIHGNDRHFDVNTTVNRHEQGIPPVTGDSIIGRLHNLPSN